MTNPTPHGTLTLRIVAIDAVAERVIALELEAADGRPLPEWAAGSHIDVHLEDDLIRQYSLMAAPSGRWRLGVLWEIESRGGSEHVHLKLSVGDEVRTSRPRNNFAFTPRGAPIIFVAGGIGITPLVSMIHSADEQDLDWTLLYLSRSTKATPFADELPSFNQRVHHHYDSAAGVIDLVATMDRLGGSTADIYACGPAGLLDALKRYCDDRPATTLTVERFSSADAPAPQDGDLPFTIELADGTEIEVAADETMLAALEREGVPTLSSCREGTCGTCETYVLFGRPDHRDYVLNAEERQSGEVIMPCVSRCYGSRIGLDLEP